MFLILTLGVISVVLALILTPVIRDRVGKFGFLDHPDGIRKKHADAVPRVGGIAIVTGITSPHSPSLSRCRSATPTCCIGRCRTSCIWLWRARWFSSPAYWTTGCA